jgi:Sulfotransferase family
VNQQLRNNLQRLNSRVRRFYGLPKSFEQVEVCANPIFVIGAPRSGTTFLGWSLANHTWLWTAGESTLIREVFGESGIASIERALEHAQIVGSESWLQGENVDRSELLARLGTGVNSLYSSRSGGRRWLDHTPAHTLLVDVLRDMFPGAVFIHVLRDGRQVVHSMTNFMNALPDERNERYERLGWTIPWLDFETACATWRDHVESAMRFGDSHPERCSTILHSRLVEEPWRAYRDIFDFLGIPFEPRPVDYCRVTRVNSSFPSEPPRSYSDPSTSWTPEQRRLFVSVAGETMVRYGFVTRQELEVDPGADVVGPLPAARGAGS